MMQVEIIREDGRIEAFGNFTTVRAGVIVEVGNHTEVLFPWHKVNCITSTERGAISANLPL